MHSGAAGNGELPGKAKGSGLMALPPIRHPEPPAKLPAPRSLALARANALGKRRLSMGAASDVIAMAKTTMARTAMVRMLTILKVLA